MGLNFHGRLFCRSQVDQIDLAHGSAGIGDEGFRTGRTKNAETFAEEIVRVSQSVVMSLRLPSEFVHVSKTCSCSGFSVNV